MRYDVRVVLGLAWLAALAGACVDPLVGGRCAPGYEPRPGVGCVRVDGGSGADAATTDGYARGDAADDAGDAVVELDAVVPSGDGPPNPVADGAADNDAARSDVAVGNDAITPDDGAVVADGISGDGGTSGDDGTSSDGGTPLDGATGDSSAGADGDAGTSRDGGTGGDAGAGDGGTGDAGCVTGTTVCSGACVDTDSDPRNCGACGHACRAGESCARGGCVTVCPPPLVACGAACVDLQTDPLNCGGCGVVCTSGLCNAGVCRDARAGHLVLIGHSYEETRPDQDRVLANAVFLASSSPARVLVYDEYADTAAGGAVAHANAAINSVGRPWTATRLTDRATVSSTLSIDRFDVMLVYEQSSATPVQTMGMATDFGDALASFARAGGVVIVLDGGTRSSSTFRVMNATGLMTVTGSTSADLMTVNLVSGIDALAVGVRTSYRAERHSASFDTPDSYAVFATGTRPVVMHRGVLR